METGAKIPVFGWFEGEEEHVGKLTTLAVIAVSPSLAADTDVDLTKPL